VAERDKNRHRAHESERRPDRARALERLALAHGKKRVRSLKDLARGTPADADELLDAIRELRKDDD
jgi:hypothetical protein